MFFYRKYIEHYKSLLKIGFPIVVGQLGIIVLSLADTMMVGHHSTQELAASSFVNNLFNLVIIFFTGYSYGLTPIVGGLFGKGDKLGVGKILKNSIAANLVMSVILVVLMSVLYLNVHRLGQPQELMPLVRPYFLVLLASLPFVMIFNAFRQFSEGTTDTATPMWILLGGNLLNIIGNWVLIYGKFGAPELGLLGAGVSTLVSRVVMVLIYIGVFIFSRKYAEYRRGYRSARITVADFRTLNSLGLPVGLQMGMETASFSLSTIMVGWLGVTALAAHQIMMTVGQLGFMVYYGFAAAVAVRISNVAEHRDRTQIRMIADAGFHLILVQAVLISVVILLLRSQLGYLFADDAEVALSVATIAIPFAVYQFGDGLQCNFANALRGICDVKPLMYSAFIAYFVVCLPLGYVFGFIFNWGLTGIWSSYIVGLTLAGALYYMRFRNRTKFSRI